MASWISATSATWSRFNFHFQLGKQKIVWQRWIWRVWGVIKGCNIFWGQKLANTCSFVGGHIIVQQKKSRAERSWTNPMNALQEVICYCFIKFCIYCFSLWFEFFVHYALRVGKNYQHVLDVGPLEFQFLRPRGCLTNPVRTLSLCFGVIGKTQGLISP